MRRLGIAVLLVFALARPTLASVHQMFVSSEIGTGNLSTWPHAGGHTGRDAADAVCQGLAADRGLENAGNFVAWLSTSADDAFCHVAGFSGTKDLNCGQAALPNAGPWVRVDAKPFSKLLQNLTSRNLVLDPPELDENGAALIGAAVLTGTDPAGRLARDGANVVHNCLDWTSSATTITPGSFCGDTSGGTIYWTDTDLQDCNSSRPIYCFEKGAGDPLPPFVFPGADVFVTSIAGTGDLGSWPEAVGLTGLEAGDRICQTVAREAGLVLPDLYVAWLSTASVDAIDRLTTNGPFRRHGGLEIAATKSGLTAPTKWDKALETAVEVDENGNHALGFPFTGTTSLGVAGGADCSGWTSAANTDSAIQGTRAVDQGLWTESATVSCDLPHSLYCFSNASALFVDDFEAGDFAAWAHVVP